MHRSAVHSAIAALVLGTVGSVATAAAGTVPSTDDAIHYIPNQYIVEYAQDAAGLAARDLGSDGSIRVLKNFESSLFSGAAVEITSSSSNSGGVSVLAAKPHIVNVWPNRRIVLDQPVSQEDPAAVLSSIAESSDVVSGGNGDGGALPYSTHRATGVDRLHAQGIRGQGVKVAIVDTGVWYLHEALGGGFGPGFKVAGGWDLVGDADPFSGEPKKPDADPISLPDFGHGTHVAGIVAAMSDNFVGVAPNATLYAYKITGSVSEGSDDATMIDAFLRAESDGVDIISLSFSSSAGWSDSAFAVVVSRIVDAGVIVTISAGNEGASGPFIGIGGGSSPGALAVASVQADLAPATPFHLTYISADGETNTTTLAGYVGDDHFPTNITGWHVVDMASTDPASAGDACEAYAADDPRNLTGTIPLVRRGGCNFSAKQANLLALGGQYVLVYNDDRGLVPPGNTLPSGTLGMIPADMGAAILKAIRQDNMTVTVDFSLSPSDAAYVGVADSAGGTPNSFSGWAATYDLQLKPDVAAPGGNILSTWSGEGNQYMVQSGTSMSTPYIAGVAALYVGVHGGRQTNPNVAKDFHRHVVASGATLPYTNNAGAVSSSFSAPPAQMGSGLVDAWRTVFAGSSVDVTRFNLNDTVHFQGEQQVTITNENTAGPVTYNFTLEPAAGFEMYSPWIDTWHTWGMQQFQDLVPMDFTPDVVLPEPVTLAPGESKTVTVTFANPVNKGWNSTVLPLYNGKVKIAGDNGDRLSVQYMGLATDLYKEKKVFQNSYESAYPIFLNQKTYDNIRVNATYNFNSSSPDFSWLAMYYQLDWGVHEMRWDIFESNWDESRWTYPPTAESGLVGLTKPWSRDWDKVSDPADPAVVRNSTIDSPIRYLARNGFALRAESRVAWLGHLVPPSGADGDSGAVRVLEPGNYTMRIAASRPFADLSKVEGWEVARYEIQVVA
ncbi:peptidase S8/S53 domain-containing protein [Microdochium trichocladiopsis]|uniref:Peptidase S8/S53 domain-containing protein n=1 Tax=Microdochium trichocladiopsis TaxID=1682393 RepID=A0A9P8YFK1_9PEZI|nr:peptidase S8/S53 domain-containing protein [Microdochium trichocladiopsis]KAH7037065.1 peptidase S8/S53 domain-containing protein [Microdochium trichocladiopsis]